MSRRLIVVFLVLITVSVVFSQGKKSLLRVNSFVGVCEYKVGEEEWLILKAGDEIPQEAEIRVKGKDDFLELIFYDDTIVKLTGLTSIKVKELVREDFSKKKNTTLFLFTGKIFSKVKSSFERVFKIETETAIISAKNTKFGVSFLPGEGGELVVTEGVVEVFDPANFFTPISVKEGNVFRLPSSLGETIFEPRLASTELLKQYDPEYIEKPEFKLKGKTGINFPVVKTDQESKPFSSFLSSLGIYGTTFIFSVGTENIGDFTYYRFCFTPTLAFGGFSFGLYFPFLLSASDSSIIEESQGIYNKKDWDFSSLPDSWNDLTSKIAFLQFKNSFLLFRIGPFSNYTLSSGLLVNKYNNDLFFPSERNNGLITSIDIGFLGFDYFIGDIGNFDLIGGRFFIKPFSQSMVINDWNIGISSFVDNNPTTNLKTKVYGSSFDIDFPFNIKKVTFGIYSEFGIIGYYDTLSNQIKFSNGFGMNTGLKLRVFPITCKVGYKNQLGGFISEYINKTYDIEKKEKFERLYKLSSYPYTNNLSQYHGFLIETDLEITNMIKAGISYEHLFPFGNDISEEVNNNLHIDLELSKNLLKKFYVAFSFDWKSFDLNTIINSSFPLPNSILATEVFYELVNGVYLGLEWKNFFERIDGEINEKVIYGFRAEILL